MAPAGIGRKIIEAVMVVAHLLGARNLGTRGQAETNRRGT